MSSPPPRLVADRVTHAGYAALAMWAWFLYGFGPVLVLLRTQEHTGRTPDALAGGGAAAAVTPFGLGALADATSTHTAFLVVPALAVAAPALLLASGRRGPRPPGLGSAPRGRSTPRAS